MGKLQEKANEYHQQFAERIIKALKEGTAPWQKPWKPDGSSNCAAVGSTRPNGSSGWTSRPRRSKAADSRDRSTVAVDVLVLGSSHGGGSVPPPTSTIRTGSLPAP